MRSATPSALAAVAGRALGIMLLIRMQLDETVYLSSSGDLEFEGKLWLGSGHVGSISSIDDSEAGRDALRFSLNGVSDANLALCLNPTVTGKRVQIREALLDPDTMQVLDAPVVWSGSLNQLTAQTGGDSAGVAVNAEHRSVTYGRLRPLRYTDGDQQRLRPGDRALQFVVAQANAKVVWPAASFFKK